MKKYLIGPMIAACKARGIPLAAKTSVEDSDIYVDHVFGSCLTHPVFRRALHHRFEQDVLLRSIALDTTGGDTGSRFLGHNPHRWPGAASPEPMVYSYPQSRFGAELLPNLRTDAQNQQDIGVGVTGVCKFSNHEYKTKRPDPGT